MPNSPPSDRRPKQGEVGLAEVIEAIARLQPANEAATEAIAFALGFGWRPGAREPQTTAKVPAPSRRAPAEPEFLPPQPTATRELQPVRRQSRKSNAVERAMDSVASLIRRIAGGQSGRQKLEATDYRIHSDPPPYRPLFREEWHRALLSAMLGTPAKTPALNTRRIAQQLHAGRPMTELPWDVKSSLRRGVILILDRSESMQPYWRDETELVERVRRVVGAAGVAAYWTQTDPWSESGARLRWLDEEPQTLPPKTPLVIVSDFELGMELRPRSLMLDPWLPLIDRAKSCGMRVLALVPVARDLWPASLRSTIPNAVVWDNSSTTRAARQWAKPK